VIKAAGRRFPEARPGVLSLSLILPGKAEATGFSHRGDRQGYPASLVKLFFMVFVQAEIEAGRLGDTREVRQALQAMIASSSNDATSHIVDILTSTTSGPELAPLAFARWLRRRQATNRFFARWRWPELAGSNLTQKTWYEAPYGRERQSRYEVKENGNRLSSDGVARLLLAIQRGEAVSRRRSRAMLGLMARFPERIDPKNPWDQMTGFLGEGLPAGTRLWSKAGWSSQTRHDAAIVELAGGQRFILAVMTFGKPLAANHRLLPFIAREVAGGVARI
jgi:beta-lactamase class A